MYHNAILVVYYLNTILKPLHALPTVLHTIEYSLKQPNWSSFETNKLNHWITLNAVSPKGTTFNPRQGQALLTSTQYTRIPSQLTDPVNQYKLHNKLLVYPTTPDPKFN